MGVSFGTSAYVEGGVILIVIAMNIVIGMVQEYKAEKTMNSLRSISSPTSTVIRNGQSKVIATIHIVPGDLVELQVGNVIPADMR